MSLEALERLGRLRASGAISEHEFDHEKRRVLEGAPQLEAEPAESMREVPIPDPSSLPKPGISRMPGWRFAALTALVAAVLGTGAYMAYDRSSECNPPSTSAPRRLSLRSPVMGIHIAAVAELPKNPHVGDNSCSPYEQQPSVAAAKEVASQGWHVTAAESIGSLIAVSFVGTCAPNPAGSFDPVDGNVALFDGERVRAVIYGRGLGFVSPGNGARQLQIRGTKSGAVLGRVTVGARSVSVRS